MIKIKQKVQFSRSKSGRQRIVDHASSDSDVLQGRVPRVSKLMALAIRFDGLLRSGEIPDQSSLARLSQVSQPRMTQIMNLLHLAPDLQEKVLDLPTVVVGRDPIHERLLRPIVAELNWNKQRKMWDELNGSGNV